MDKKIYTLNEKNLLLDLYVNAIKVARNNKQTVGEKNDFYITLEQLSDLLANNP